MPSQLANAHIAAEARLRALIRDALGQTWRSLPGYDAANVDEWLSRVVPLVTAGQRTSASLTDAYLARFMGRQPFGVSDDIIGPQIRNGTPPEEVWRRPFVTLWSKLGEGAAFVDASGAALARAQGMASFDVQAAARSTFAAVQTADPQIIGYERVADGGACPFCQEIDGAFVKSADAMGLHNGCGCGLEPVTAQTRGARKSAERANPNVAFRDHGELGSTIGSPEHSFTSPADLG